MHAGPTGESDSLNIVCSVPNMWGEVGPQNRVQNITDTEQPAI